jgi:hypothetical protein
MSVDQYRKARGLVLVAGALVSTALVLSGCSSTIADMPSLSTPSDAPSAPREAGPYLPVNDLPPEREAAAISPEERAKIEKELLAARDRQAAASAKDAAPK